MRLPTTTVSSYKEKWLIPPQRSLFMQFPGSDRDICLYSTPTCLKKNAKWRAWIYYSNSAANLRLLNVVSIFGRTNPEETTVVDTKLHMVRKKSTITSRIHMCSKASYKQEDGKYVNLNPVQRSKRWYCTLSLSVNVRDYMCLMLMQQHLYQWRQHNFEFE